MEKEIKENPENFDDGLTQVMPKEFNLKKSLEKRRMLPAPEKGINLSEKIIITTEIEDKSIHQSLPVIYTGNIKEFIKIVEKIIIERKSRRLQLIELRKSAGDDLI